VRAGVLGLRPKDAADSGTGVTRPRCGVSRRPQAHVVEALGEGVAACLRFRFFYSSIENRPVTGLWQENSTQHKT
jgi:hypothetical protein